MGSMTRKDARQVTLRLSKPAAIAVIGVAVVVVGGLVYISLRRPVDVETQRALDIAEQRDKLESEIEKLVNKVGRHALLPQGEVPRLITLDTLDKVQIDAEFYRLAEVGDKVLVYELNKRAYLYRPSEDRLVNISTVEFVETDTIKEILVQEQPIATVAGEATQSAEATDAAELAE
jgi:hypothetical protein